MRRSVAIGLGLIVVAAAGGAWRLARRSEATRARGRAGPAVRAATGPVTACALRADERLAYTLGLHASFAQAGIGGGRAWERASLSAHVEAQVVEAHGEAPRRSYTLAARMDAPRMTLGDRPVADEVLAGLAAPVLFRLDERCRVTELAFAPDVPAAAANEWQILLEMSELVRPVDGASAWTERQTDTLGDYDAAYARTATAEGERVTRRKLGYARVHGAPGLEAPTATLLRASASGRFVAGRGWFDAVDVDEHVRVRLRERTLIEARGVLKLAAAPLGAPWPAPDRARYRWRKPGPLQPPTELPYAQRPPIAGLADRSTASILDEFARRIGDPKAAQFDDALNLLVQALRLRPAMAAELLDRLLAQADPTDVRSMIFLALQLSGTADAHHVLARAIDDGRLPTADRLRAVSALADVPNPDAATLAALVAARGRAGNDAEGRQLAVTALLGVGSMAKNGGLPDELRAQVHELVAGELGRASGMEDRRAALAAAGNTGDATHADAVRRQIASDEPDVRAAAYDALDRIGALPPARELVDVFLRDDAPGVRRALDGPLTRRAEPLDDETIARCAAALASTPDVRERATLVEVLGLAARTSPAAKAALQARFRVEREPSILVLIGRYLTAAELR